MKKPIACYVGLHTFDEGVMQVAVGTKVGAIVHQQLFRVVRTCRYCPKTRNVALDISTNEHENEFLNWKRVNY